MVSKEQQIKYKKLTMQLFPSLKMSGCKKKVLREYMKSIVFVTQPECWENVDSNSVRVGDHTKTCNTSIIYLCISHNVIRHCFTLRNKSVHYT